MGDNTIKIRIGRGSFNDIVVDDESVLMEHCYIVRDKTGFRVVNLKKDSKTFVNDEEINWEADLAPEDRLRVGNCEVDWKNIPDRKKEELPPEEEYVEIPYGMNPMIDIESATEPNTATNKGNGKKRNGFVTFWIWFVLIANLISIPVGISKCGDIFRPLKYQLISPPYNMYDTDALVEGVSQYEGALQIVILIFSILAVIFLAKLLHWKKIGFWGFACTIITSNIVFYVILKAMMSYGLSYGIRFYIVGTMEITRLIIPAVQIIIMWAILQIRKNGISCWKQLYWKSDSSKAKEESDN